MAKVSAKNALGSSSFSEAGQGGFIFTVPDAPINFANNPSVTDTNQIGLTWSPGTFDGGSPVIDYTVSLSEETSDLFTDYITNEVGTSTTVTGLTDDKSYKFYVTARNQAGYSLPSQIISVTTLPLIIQERPSAPLNLRNVPSITNANQIGLEWDLPLTDGQASIIDYRLSMLTEGESNFNLLVAGVVQRSYTVQSLKQGLTYKFKVEARNEIGFSPTSEEVSILAA